MRWAGGSCFYKSRGNCAAKVKLARCEDGSVRFNKALEAKVEAIGGDQVGEQRRQGLSQISAEWKVTGAGDIECE